MTAACRKKHAWDIGNMTGKGVGMVSFVPDSKDFWI
jgi:hypothetical protein